MSARTETFLAETALGLAILAVVLVAWLAVKGCELVVRTFAAHPTSTPLWLALGGVLATGLACLLTSVQLLELAALLPATLAGLLGTAKEVELVRDPLLQR